VSGELKDLDELPNMKLKAIGGRSLGEGILKLSNFIAMYWKIRCLCGYHLNQSLEKRSGK
jgi:hypothetical protein